MAEESLEGGTIERKLPDGIELQPIYTRASAERFGMEAGVPGEVPFTRGSVLQPIVGSRICQELPYGRPADFNQALLQDLNRGQNAVNLLLDVATRLGLDPDEAEIGEVGGCGLSIATVSDLNRALSGVDLSAIPLYAQAGTSSVPLLAMLVTGWMARQSGGAGQAQDSSMGGLGGLIGSLGGMFGGNAGAAGAGAQGGLGGLGAMLDMNGDGNVLDDIMRMAGKAGR